MTKQQSQGFGGQQTIGVAPGVVFYIFLNEGEHAGFGDGPTVFNIYVSGSSPEGDGQAPFSTEVPTNSGETHESGGSPKPDDSGKGNGAMGTETSQTDETAQESGGSPKPDNTKGTKSYGVESS